MDSDQRFKLIIIAPTCFYYQTALFQQLAAHPRIDLTVYFCSREALDSDDVATMYNTDSRWGLKEELVAGYKHKFLKNFSPTPSYTKWPFGLVNLGIWGEIRREKPHAVILMSWMNPTWWLAVLACVLGRIPYLYMTDANIQAELTKDQWKMWLKKALLGKVIFRISGGFLCSGTANKLLFSYYGVPDQKMVPFAYSWGYKRLLEISEELRPKRNRIRAELGIPEDRYVILYCGRLSKEKNPLALLQAFDAAPMPNKYLAFVGDGELMGSLRELVESKNIGSVGFFGFQDRKEISKFYAMADVLVLPSQRETWGIVVNEALCFGLPVITSDQVGAALDFVLDNFNGYTFPAGDLEGLTNCLKQLAALPDEERRRMGERSLDLMRSWTQMQPVENLLDYLDTLFSQRKVRT